MTTASTYRQRQDIIQGVPCPNCGQIRWARQGDGRVHCQECESVFTVRTLWAEMSDLPMTPRGDPEIHMEHAEFASLVTEYALLDQGERQGGPGDGAATLFDRGQRLQRLEDMLPADVCAAIQVLNELAAHRNGMFARQLAHLAVQ
jgi:hypothetical protein